MPLPSRLLHRPRRTASDGAAEAANIQNCHRHGNGHPDHLDQTEPNGLTRLPLSGGRKGQREAHQAAEGAKGSAPSSAGTSGGNGASSGNGGVTGKKPTWRMWGLDSRDEREKRASESRNEGGESGRRPIAKAQSWDGGELNTALNPVYPLLAMKSVDEAGEEELEEEEERKGEGGGVSSNHHHCDEPEGSSRTEQPASLADRQVGGNRSDGLSIPSPAWQKPPHAGNPHENGDDGSPAGAPSLSRHERSHADASPAAREPPPGPQGDGLMEPRASALMPSSKSCDPAGIDRRRPSNRLMSRRKRRAQADSLVSSEISHVSISGDTESRQVVSNRCAEGTRSITRTMSGGTDTSATVNETSAVPPGHHGRSLTDGDRTIRWSIPRRLASLLPGMFSRSSSRQSNESSSSPASSSSHAGNRSSASWVNLSWRSTGSGAGVGASSRSMASLVSDQSSRWEGSGVGQLAAFRSRVGVSAGKIDRKYALEGMIGQGQSGMVSRCRHRESERRFACKTIMKKALVMDGRMGEVYNEVSGAKCGGGGGEGGRET